MDPLALYLSIFLACAMLGVALRIGYRVVARKCPQCGGRVQVGNVRCHVCGYRFTDARE